MRRIALIPARSGSKRIKDKNIHEILGKPLIQYTLETAEETGIFDKIIVSTDSIRYKKIISELSACDIRIRPVSISGDFSPDIQWLQDVFVHFNLSSDDALFILRPTSPLRTVRFIVDAWENFSKSEQEYHSLRAVTRAEIHPGKMWTIVNGELFPLYPFTIEGVPWHSNQTALLPPIYQQTASLEIVWGSTIIDYQSLSGTRIMPWICNGFDAFDINVPEDLAFMKYYLESSMRTDDN